MKRFASAAFAAVLCTATAAQAEDYTLTPADAEDMAISYSVLNTVASILSGASGGADIEISIKEFKQPTTLRGCMALAFASANVAGRASISCFKDGAELAAVYSCRPASYKHGTRCRRDF